ncbi:MAG TPA: DNA polymerase III subunit chi [Burkholderiales bacterium]|nr:DNA polymerase III subunit chi [Burkholderiales bacterium]
MTQIDFYTHVDDRLATACRLAAKAFNNGLRVMVFCPEAETARRFDRLLWTTPAISFIPHCFSGDALAPVTPVIVGHDDGDPPHDQVLLNLRPEWPPFFSRFQRLIEIVSLDGEDRKTARERFRFYRDRGYEIRTHDLSQAGQQAG